MFIVLKSCSSCFQVCTQRSSAVLRGGACVTANVCVRPSRVSTDILQLAPFLQKSIWEHSRGSTTGFATKQNIYLWMKNWCHAHRGLWASTETSEFVVKRAYAGVDAVNKITWSPQQKWDLTSCLCLLHHHLNIAGNLLWTHLCERQTAKKVRTRISGDPPAARVWKRLLSQCFLNSLIIHI